MFMSLSDNWREKILNSVDDYTLMDKLVHAFKMTKFIQHDQPRKCLDKLVLVHPIKKSKPYRKFNSVVVSKYCSKYFIRAISYSC